MISHLFFRGHEWELSTKQRATVASMSECFHGEMECFISNINANVA